MNTYAVVSGWLMSMSSTASIPTNVLVARSLFVGGGVWHQ
jgi:hypothetical protein